MDKCASLDTYTKICNFIRSHLDLKLSGLSKDNFNFSFENFQFMVYQYIKLFSSKWIRTNHSKEVIYINEYCYLYWYNNVTVKQELNNFSKTELKNYLDSLKIIKNNLKYIHEINIYELIAQNYLNINIEKLIDIIKIWKKIDILVYKNIIHYYLQKNNNIIYFLIKYNKTDILNYFYLPEYYHYFEKNLEYFYKDYFNFKK